jgi:hypothetical protein
MLAFFVVAMVALFVLAGACGSSRGVIHRLAPDPSGDP